MSQINTITVIGMGNPILCDDSVGLLIIDALEQRISKNFPEVEFKKNYSGGMDLLDDLVDKEKAIITDCVKTENRPPGFCHEFSIEQIDEITQPRIVDSHSLDLLTVLETGERCGYSIPKDILIYGIEGTDFSEFSEEPSLAVKKGMKITINKIIKKLEAWCNEQVVV